MVSFDYKQPELFLFVVCPFSIKFPRGIERTTEIKSNYWGFWYSVVVVK